MMIRYYLPLLLSLVSFFTQAQSPLTPELLWSLGRVSPMGISIDQSAVIYAVRHYDYKSNESTRAIYSIPLAGGKATKIENTDGLLRDDNISPDGQYKLSSQRVKVEKVMGQDFYEDVKNSNVQIYDDLMYRHWDAWFDGKYNHVILSSTDGKQEADIMEGLKYHCPTMPYGGSEDYIWSPDSKKVIYVMKEKTGKDFALSTNTDLYSYDLASQTTINLTSGMNGYDTSPAFSSKGKLAWLSMDEEGYESDKNDIIVDMGFQKLNLTKQWDGTVFSFTWADDGANIYFIAPRGGTRQLFVVDYPGMTKKLPVVRQITDGQFDVNSIVGQVGNTLVVTRTDMHHAKEIYTVDLGTGNLKKLTSVNDDIYAKIKSGKIEKRMIKTTDGKDMLTWVIYPPDFDPAKKYPTLLYCKGGPQGALSQGYSFRWNYQLMAANGYIIVAPSRRGMSGFGIAWNEQISKDYGGQNMQDYLSAIDAMAKESFVDENRLGAVGASYGGYSIFYLAGIHEGRFKSLISHDGIFNWRSMYGTTEELFFVNWDLGGNYWDKKNEAAQRSHTIFNPINMVDKWDTPLLIFQGGKDYRVPIGQGLEAFQAAQLKGIKSRLIYLPDENHHVLTPANAMVWQREFYRWLKETL